MGLGFLTGMSALERVFFFCAVVSGLFFLLRIALLLVGVGHGTGDLTPHMDMTHDTHIVGSSDTSFQLLSIQSLTAFFLMFGLVGLTLTRGSGINEGLAILGAFVAGLGTMFLIAYITALMFRLQSSGTMDVRKAVGEEGTVYLTIPADGTGQAQISVQNRLSIFDAVAADKKPIKTGEHIKVVRVTEGKILVVERV